MSDEAKRDQFEYLLNAMDLAAASREPAKKNYAAKRRAVIQYASALRGLADGYEALCVAYRVGDHRRADKALARIENAKETLARIVTDHAKRCEAERATESE